ncbi:MAG: hypothetical protein OHK0029_05770 [Armatimonadaceae bacterium]
MFGGLITLATTTVVVGLQQNKLREMPELGPLKEFKSKREKPELFDSKGKMKPINLTESGAKDWVVWGYDKATKPIRKAGTKKWISDYELIQPGNKTVQPGKRGPSRAIVWKDGNPVKAVDVTYAGVHAAKDNGFRFKVPATTETQTLEVYVGGYKAGGNFSAFLTDGSPVAMTTQDVALEEGYYSRTYSVDFKATAPNQELTVVWRINEGSGGNISLQGAALR